MKSISKNPTLPIKKQLRATKKAGTYQMLSKTSDNFFINPIALKQQQGIKKDEKQSIKIVAAGRASNPIKLKTSQEDKLLSFQNKLNLKVEKLTRSNKQNASSNIKQSSDTKLKIANVQQKPIIPATKQKLQQVKDYNSNSGIQQKLLRENTFQKSKIVTTENSTVKACNSNIFSSAFENMTPNSKSQPKQPMFTKLNSDIKQHQNFPSHIQTLIKELGNKNFKFTQGLRQTLQQKSSFTQENRNKQQLQQSNHPKGSLLCTEIKKFQQVYQNGMFSKMMSSNEPKENMATSIKKFFEIKQKKEKKSKANAQNTTQDEKQKERQITEVEYDQRFAQTAEDFYLCSNLQQSQLSQPEESQAFKLYSQDQNTVEIEKTALDSQQSNEVEVVSICTLHHPRDVKYFQERFFRDMPSEEPQIDYYIHHLLNQTPMSSQVREHIRENFAQMKHFKEKILPLLPQAERKIIDLPKPIHKQSLLLIYQIKQFKELKTLVLDLDETLIHCMDSSDNYANGINSLHDIHLTPSPDSSPLLLQISLRPGLQDFLKQVTQWFEVLIFTASEKSYAVRTLELINPSGEIDGVLSREDCLTLSSEEFIKDLSCLSRDEIIIVDNSLVAVRQTDALVPIIPYYGDDNDRQLKELLPYLKELSDTNCMVEKNKEKFLWDIFYKSKVLSDYFRELRKRKGNHQNE